MKVNLLLADSAQVVGGKLYLLGGGWSAIGPDPTPFAFAMLIEVPWNEANQRFRFKLELLSEDGQPVAMPTPQGEQPLVLDGAFEVGRPPQLPLEPDRVYAWRLSIDDETEDDWRRTFTTRPRQHAGAMPGGLAAP